MKNKTLMSIVLLSLSSLAITACNQDQPTSKTSLAAVKKYPQATTLQGTVSNAKGAVTTGTVTATDDSGKLISTAAVANSHYRIEIPANTVLPIVLTFASETDSEKLSAVVIDDTITQYFINPATTAIAKTAKAMGGYTRANMIRAAEETVHVPDANKTSTGWRGDPTTQYGGWH